MKSVVGQFTGISRGPSGASVRVHPNRIAFRVLNGTVVVRGRIGGEDVDMPMPGCIAPELEKLADLIRGHNGQSEIRSMQRPAALKATLDEAARAIEAGEDKATEIETRNLDALRMLMGEQSEARPGYVGLLGFNSICWEAARDESELAAISAKDDAAYIATAPVRSYRGGYARNRTVQYANAEG